MGTYDFYISKIMFNLIALFGFLLVFIAGMYWGYTFKENDRYINVSTREIMLVNTINSKYTYNFIHNENKKYGEEIAPRIANIVSLLSFIGILLLEIGYRNACKYKYDKPIDVRFKEFIERIKKAE